LFTELEKGFSDYKDSRYSVWMHLVVKSMAGQRENHKFAHDKLGIPEIIALSESTATQPSGEFQKVVADVPAESRSRGFSLRRFTLRGTDKKKLEEEKLKMQQEEREKQEKEKSLPNSPTFTAKKDPPPPIVRDTPRASVEPPPPIERDTLSVAQNVWQEVKSEAGETYYYNTITNESAWEIPK